MWGYSGGFNLADFGDFFDEWYFGTPFFFNVFSIGVGGWLDC